MCGVLSDKCLAPADIIRETTRAITKVNADFSLKRIILYRRGVSVGVECLTSGEEREVRQPSAIINENIKQACRHLRE